MRFEKVPFPVIFEPDCVMVNVSWMLSVLLIVAGGGLGFEQVSLTVSVPEYEPAASGTAEEVA